MNLWDTKLFKESGKLNLRAYRSKIIHIQNLDGLLGTTLCGLKIKHPFHKFSMNGYFDRCKKCLQLYNIRIK